MADALMEAKAALSKSKDEIAKYYDQQCIPAPNYQPGDKVYLDTSDIKTTRHSQRLSHKRLGPFTIIREVGNSAYHLQNLPPLQNPTTPPPFLRPHTTDMYISPKKSCCNLTYQKMPRWNQDILSQLLPYREVPLLL